ncbi:choice-of-anchor D domain-containing protein, partial [Candidatus Fermentibacteria bacterium]|nr:choice-of-anchor D domain-containing protein [Candidatus Fermentibacteria bacterium]
MRILRESPRRVTRMASVLTCLAMMAVVSERCTKDPSSPPGPPQPEIAVSPTSLSYSVAVDGSQTKSLVVTNSGKATLNVSSISVNASWLEGIMQSFSVSPGSAQEMMVTANAHGMSAGDYNATITIASNDPDEATKTVGVTFEVTSTSQPDIDVSPTSLSMDTVWTGGSTTATLTVQNVGNATLNVTSITDNQDWLSESPTSFSVNAGSSRAVTVTASAASLG